MIISGVVLFGLAEMNGIGDPAQRIKLHDQTALGPYGLYYSSSRPS